MIRSAFIILLGGLLFYGCKENPVKTDSVKVSSGNTNTPDLIADSLAAKKIWDVHDYLSCIKVVGEWKQKGEDKFIDFLQHQGSVLFTRLTDYASYRQIAKAGETVDKRFESYNMLTTGLSSFLKMIYIPKKENGKLVIGHQILQSFTAMLAITGVTVEIIGEKFPDKEKLDPVRKQGLQKVQAGLFQMIMGALVTISTDHKIYEEKDIVNLASFVKSFVPTVSTFLQKSQLDQVNVSVEKVKLSDTYSSAKAIMAAK